jgi:hypothetical protein
MQKIKIQIRQLTHISIQGIETFMWRLCNVTSHCTPMDNVLNTAKNDSERSPAVCHILRAHSIMGNFSRLKYKCLVLETTEFRQHKITGFNNNFHIVWRSNWTQPSVLSVWTMIHLRTLAMKTIIKRF